VRAAGQDSDGRERLLRYCARPMFAGERLVWAGGGVQVRYRLPWAALQGHRLEQQKQRSIELRLSASEFLDRVAALIPPPRKHRHRYFGVLAPNSPWRALLVAQAGRKLGAGSKAPWPKTVRTDFGATRAGHPARSPPPEMEFAQRLAAPEAVFEAIPELEFAQTANPRLKPGMIGWCTLRVSMQSRSWKWSSTRHRRGHTALQK